jgi:glycosyltransferase involved in cell wall biosynthesis
MSLKKNLLIVSQVFLSGGLETHIAGEARQLSNLGFDVHLVVGQEYQRDALPSECKSLTTDLSLGPEATTSELLEAVKALVDLAEKHSIEIIHCHPFTAFLPAFLASQAVGVPLVCTLHGPMSLELTYGELYEPLLYGLVLPSASLVCCVSEEVLTLARAHVAKKRCVIVPNAVDVERFVPSPGPISDRWVIVSRLDELKIAGIKQFLLTGEEFGGIRKSTSIACRKGLTKRLSSSGLGDSWELCRGCWNGPGGT